MLKTFREWFEQGLLDEEEHEKAKADLVSKLIVV